MMFVMLVHVCVYEAVASLLLYQPRNAGLCLLLETGQYSEAAIFTASTTCSNIEIAENIMHDEGIHVVAT